MCVCDRISRPPCYYCRQGEIDPETRSQRIQEGVERSLRAGREHLEEVAREKERLRLRRRKTR